MSWLRGVRRGLGSVYLRELPRIVREQRWTLLVIVTIHLLSAAIMYHWGREASSDEVFEVFQRMNTPRWYDSILPSASWGVRRSTWLWFLTRNTFASFLYFLSGAASFGLLSLAAAIAHGGDLGWLVGAYTGMATQAAGVGAAGTAAGILLPHGFLEFPALWLARALGLRTGLAWVRPLRNLRRWPSVKRLIRDYCIALLAIVPLLLIASLLEVYANPILFDRYVIGIGAYPAMSREERIGPHFLACGSAWSPDGKWLAVLSPFETSVAVVSTGGDSEPLVVAEEGERRFSVPSWSPDGGRLVFAHRFMEYARRDEGGLTIVDVATLQVQRIEGGPTGTYWGAAWSPHGGSIAAIISHRVGDRYHGTNLWLVDLRTREWKQVTHFAPSVRVAPLTYPSWRPDGKEIAFIRLTGPTKGDSEGEAPSSPQRSFDLCAVRRNGSGVRTITPVGMYSAIAWSPTGEWIAFHAGAEPTDPLADIEKPFSAGVILEDVALVRPNASERIDGLTGADLYSSLSWSPDGTQLLYHRLSTCIVGTL